MVVCLMLIIPGSIAPKICHQIRCYKWFKRKVRIDLAGEFYSALDFFTNV
jgi:hypothetical protein